jgi:hypothetical protein
MEKREPSEWMPVFMVLPAKSEVAATAGEGTHVDVIATKTGRDYWQRIGTARTHKDGSIWVRLDAAPINGRLVIRPPQAGEVYDPTV